jgi:hypothetical protein
MVMETEHLFSLGSKGTAYNSVYRYKSKHSS